MITIAAATCLALNVYFEARDQDIDGQRMVAEVSMERVHETGFPKSICGVVWQPGAFSWTNDGKSDTPRDDAAWLEAQIIADEVLLYGCQLCTGATYYHTSDTYPYWAKDMAFVGVWGDHVFYARKGDDE